MVVNSFSRCLLCRCLYKEGKFCNIPKSFIISVESMIVNLMKSEIIKIDMLVSLWHIMMVNWCRLILYVVEFPSRPNCEKRKWTVLGETTLEIFVLKNIPLGKELTINYYFEWYAGATVRCLCGGAKCCIFLVAKSQSFMVT
uniref:SET domain-containing protein n=1 Tax=Solanum lycopersicum TaxID=4081 RepID=A0A3Q7GTG1_SOLLC